MSLALTMWSYAAASVALGVQLADGFSAWHVLPPALGAYVAASVATIGAVMRARWSSAASVVTAVLLVTSAFSVDLAELTSSQVGSWRFSILVMVVIGAFAASAAAVLSWRSARSLLGTLRSVVS